MLQTVAKSMKISRIFSSRYHFSVLFMDRKDIISPYDIIITDIKEEDLKDDISKQLNKQYLSQLT